MSGVHHSAFSRIKSMFANITADEARARGYTKGKKKLEEVFTLLKRVTTPQTVYKKQKLDRDDIIDITDFSVVAWIKGEMRMMLDEELARAYLIGDGRSSAADERSTRITSVPSLPMTACSPSLLPLLPAAMSMTPPRTSSRRLSGPARTTRVLATPSCSPPRIC